MKYKVLDIKDYIHMICIFDKTVKVNQYRLYLVYNARHETYEYYTERKKQIARYGDMASILCMIRDLYINGIQYKPVDMVLSWCEEYYNN